MYFLIYNSYAADSFNEDDLKLMLIQYRKKNNEHAVTGMLFYFDRQFLQLVEGEKQVIKQLYQNILNDKKHTNTMVLQEGEIDVRFFADWSMGYKSVQPDKLVDEESFTGPGLNTLNKDSALKLFRILLANKQKL